MHSAENGFDPWLKTTEIQYKDVDDQRARFDFVLDNVHRQLALQLKPDTAKTKPLPPKK
jgi:hypothetical protein